MRFQSILSFLVVVLLAGTNIPALVECAAVSDECVESLQRFVDEASPYTASPKGMQCIQRFEDETAKALTGKATDLKSAGTDAFRSLLLCLQDKGIDKSRIVAVAKLIRRSAPYISDKCT